MYRAQGAVEVIEKIESLRGVAREYLKGVSTGTMNKINVTNVPSLQSKTEVKN